MSSSSSTPSSGGGGNIGAVRGFLLVFAGVLLVGGLILRLFDLHPWAGTNSSSQNGTQQTAYMIPIVTPTPTTTTTQCDGQIHYASLTAEPQTLNADDSCNMYGLVKSGRVKLTSVQTGDYADVGPEGANLSGRNFGEAQATTQTALYKYVLCPGVKHNMDTWACE